MGFNESTRAMIGNMALGLRVDRATATLPQGTAAAIFNIVGGKVLITGILGECTTAIGGANNTKLTANPTVATAGSADLCAVVDTNACDVGDILSITGTPADAMVAAHVGACQMMGPLGVACQVGTIDLDCAGSVTGAIKWSIWYIPLDDGAYVTAA